MKLPMVQVPQSIPQERIRKPQDNIPQTRAERERVLKVCRDYVRDQALATPLSIEELKQHAEKLVDTLSLDRKYVDYTGVILNNEAWRENLASIPYERRLLLLSKCLRVEDKCPAPFDEFGLLCKECGLCSIQDLQNEAERLGYACLVAEGSSIVMAMIQTGQIEAIVGVSCLNVLERAFPYTEAAAVPAIAIPLLQDDCRDCTVDLEWVWDYIHLSSDDKTRRLDLDSLKKQVQSWFEAEALDAIMGTDEDRTATDRIAREWLSREGKRWRPFLTVCATHALKDDFEVDQAPLSLKKIAVAVECFHKASLIHDDIEDDDDTRYGQNTLHKDYGVAVALNVGDYLLGEGYRLLSECDVPASVRARMTEIAVRGHRTLCLGQGDELIWSRKPEPLNPRQVMEIFRKKTAPAFSVALELGAAYAEASDSVFEVLQKYSDALGIAYQIRDDLDDLNNTGDPSDLEALRPTLPMALAHKKARKADKDLMTSAWQRDPSAAQRISEIREIMTRLEVDAKCKHLLETYKEEAVRALVPLEQEHSSLKGLLRRVIGKIFQIEIKGWCNEFEARNAPNSEARAEAVG